MTEVFIKMYSHGRGQDIQLLGAKDLLVIHSDADFKKLDDFLNQYAQEFIGVMLSYELKDLFEELCSDNPSFISCPLAVFFVAKEVRKEAYSPIGGDLQSSAPSLKHISRARYLEQVEQLQSHIQRGDIYEVNYCQEFQVDGLHVDPSSLFNRLMEITKAPYSAHFRWKDLHLLCASPESFLTRRGEQLLSSPIKGTRPRHQDPDEDLRIKNELANDRKERAENIMITDLVRNDLSRIALSNSVRVDKLCAIHSFKTVHQMISSISCSIPPKLPFSEMLRATFPMGSMTGAPKVSAMKLIEEHEDFRRSWYSGSLGYIAPGGDFKLNVVIRSILFDHLAQKASFAAGGAITALSDPVAEYEESMLKAQAMLSALGLSLSKGKLT